MSTAEYVVGVDIGSTGTKVVLLHPENGLAAELSASVVQFSDAAGWSEADPDQWWSNLCDLLPALLTAAGVDNTAVAGIAVSGMVPAVVLCDGDGQPLRRAILQNDARAVREIEQLHGSLGEHDLLALTGSALTQQSVAPTLVWLARHEPAVWSATRAVMGSYDWVAHRLGAASHIEWNWALESGLFDLRTRRLLPVVLDAAGVDANLVPPVAEPGTQVGTVSSPVAAETGLRPGTPIYVGGADHVLSAYAAGLARPGDWLVKLGGAGDILAVTDSPFLDARLYLDAHPKPGLWLPNGCMASSGSLIRWFQSIHGGATLEVLEAEAASSVPADLVCLPYFLGEKSPIHDPDLRGAFLGLHLGHGRGDLYRAVLEGIAFGFRHHVEVFNERGVTLGAARVTNGGSRSRIWKQILADAIGVPLWPVLDHPGSSLGAAMAAAVGSQLVPDWGTAVQHVTVTDPVVPDPKLTDRYTEAYQIYRDAGTSLTPIAHRLARRTYP
ncbi:MAG: FGGY-family carbohydrate kinase [Mycobacteriaceae bacterium]